MIGGRPSGVHGPSHGLPHPFGRSRKPDKGRDGGTEERRIKKACAAPRSPARPPPCTTLRLSGHDWCDDKTTLCPVRRVFPRSEALGALEEKVTCW